MAAKNKLPGMGKDAYEDGVVVYNNHSERWQKYGHDRIYPSSAKEGYVDINAGEVVEMTIRIDSGVREYELSFNAEEDALELLEVPERKYEDRGKNKIAKIPTDVIA